MIFFTPLAVLQCQVGKIFFVCGRKDLSLRRDSYFICKSNAETQRRGGLFLRRQRAQEDISIANENFALLRLCV